MVAGGNTSLGQRTKQEQGIISRTDRTEYWYHWSNCGCFSGFGSIWFVLWFQSYLISLHPCCITSSSGCFGTDRFLYPCLCLLILVSFHLWHWVHHLPPLLDRVSILHAKHQRWTCDTLSFHNKTSATHWVYLPKVSVGSKSLLLCDIRLSAFKSIQIEMELTLALLSFSIESYWMYCQYTAHY